MSSAVRDESETTDPSMSMERIVDSGPHQYGCGPQSNTLRAGPGPNGRLSRLQCGGCCLRFPLAWNRGSARSAREWCGEVEAEVASSVVEQQNGCRMMPFSKSQGRFLGACNRCDRMSAMACV